MIRTSIAAALVYALGLPFFDGYRPAVLDEPLHTFAAQINLAAQYSWRVVPSIDVARVKHYVAAYAERAGTSCAGPTIDPRGDRAYCRSIRRRGGIKEPVARDCCCGSA